jgi:hypothetical protein
MLGKIIQTIETQFIVSANPGYIDLKKKQKLQID